MAITRAMLQFMLADVFGWIRLSVDNTIRVDIAGTAPESPALESLIYAAFSVKLRWGVNGNPMDIDCRGPGGCFLPFAAVSEKVYAGAAGESKHRCGGECDEKQTAIAVFTLLIEQRMGIDPIGFILGHYLQDQGMNVWEPFIDRNYGFVHKGNFSAVKLFIHDALRGGTEKLLQFAGEFF
jgi:hypothetical protein